MNHTEFDVITVTSWFRWSSKVYSMPELLRFTVILLNSMWIQTCIKKKLVFPFIPMSMVFFFSFNYLCPSRQFGLLKKETFWELHLPFCSVCILTSQFEVYLLLLETGFWLISSLWKSLNQEKFLVQLIREAIG